MRTARRAHQAQAQHRTLVVRTASARSTVGVLELGSLRFRCALGRAGSKTRKREGDGASPVGEWTLRGAYYRSDRLARPRTGLKLRPLKQRDGWCDASGDRNYNRLIAHPYPASAEQMWREDGLYDIVIVLGYNDWPRVKGHGSAIFLHCARDGYRPTEGCIALAKADLVCLLAHLGRNTSLRII